MLHAPGLEPEEELDATPPSRAVSSQASDLYSVSALLLFLDSSSQGPTRLLSWQSGPTY